MRGTEIDGIPIAGFGVYALDPQETRAGVAQALEAGYRHIDTAQSYHNEADCGIAIEQSNIPKDEVFVATKVTPRNFAAGKMFGSVEQSRDNIRVDAIDLVLLHYPYPWDQIPMEVYLEQLAELHQAGLAKMVGLSNFNISQVEFARSFLGDIKVATNQVEIHIYMQNRRIVEHCRKSDIPLIAYCALARGTLFGVPEANLGPHPVLTRIAAEHDATVAQIGLAFLYHEGHIALSTTLVKEQVVANFAALNIELEGADMERLRALDMNKRIVETPYFPVFD